MNPLDPLDLQQKRWDCNAMLHLSLATPADISAIRHLAQRIWRAHYPEVIGTAQTEYMLGKFYSEESLRQQMAEGQEFWLVQDAAEPGGPLGFLAVSDKGEGQFFLHKFYLDNERRGRGLGKIVFDLLLARCAGLRELRLTVNRQNFKSINFYFRIGFVIEQCLDLPIDEGFVMNDFLMHYRI
jgi:diamine N-acetyltransferase